MFQRNEFSVRLRFNCGSGRKASARLPVASISSETIHISVPVINREFDTGRHDGYTAWNRCPAKLIFQEVNPSQTVLTFNGFLDPVLDQGSQRCLAADEDDGRRTVRKMPENHPLDSSAPFILLLGIPQGRRTRPNPPSTTCESLIWFARQGSLSLSKLKNMLAPYGHSFRVRFLRPGEGRGQVHVFG